MEGKLTPGVGVQICAPGAHFAKRKMGGDGDSKYHAGWGSGLTDWRCLGRCCLGVDDGFTLPPSLGREKKATAGKLEVY